MIKIVTLSHDHWDSVRSIYMEGIATRMATFETDVPSWEEWDSAHLSTCRLIAIDESKIVGWAALSPVSNRSAYEGVAEISIYIQTMSQGKGIGSILMNSIIDRSEQEGIWTLECTMFPENQASLRLHQSCGFRQVGYREKVGRLDGVWRDTVLMERRSELIR